MPQVQTHLAAEANELIPEATGSRKRGQTVWLFTPPLDMTTFAASAFAPVSEDWISAFTSPNPDIAPCAMSSETLSPRPFSWHGWRTRPWLQLLCGTICEPSTAALGVARFISSLPDIHASRSRSQAFAGASTTLDISGPMLPVSSAKSRRNGASSRTSPAISPSVSETSSETFNAWAIALLRASNQRRKSARRTAVTGCSFWPTPTFKGSGNRACIQVGPEGLRFRDDLNQTGKQIGIRNAASAWTLLWDILIASGWDPGPFPSSHRVRVIFGSGEKYSIGGPSLNPAFTDHLMGWPMGWTDPRQPVTGWSPWLQQCRGVL